MSKIRLLRWTTVTLLVVLLALVGVVWFGPVTVGNKKILLDFILGRGIAPPSAAQAAELLQAADGFKVDIYAEIPLARWPLATAAGDVIVARTRGNAVVLVERDRNGDGRPDAIRTLVENIDHPHGLALRDGWLYIGHRTGIARVRFDEGTGHVTGTPQNIVDDFAGDGNHTTKTIGFGPDGWLYVTQGSSCNACIEQDERRATMMRMHPDGSGREIFATGLRNSVGFDWAPWDGALYATDNGRDLLGDDFPPCELNHVERGRFYGWPYVNGNNVPDPDFGAANARSSLRRPCRPCMAFARTTHRSAYTSCKAATCRLVMNARRSSRCTARGTAANSTATKWSPSTSLTTAASPNGIS